MKNILSIDIEEYFQVENFKSVISFSQWDSYESRLNVGLDVILKILQDYHVKVTFFVLGWTAERHPECIKKIAAEGHEIGSHGYAHELIYKQGPVGFRDDLRKSLDILEPLAGEKIVSYRAPCFSITEKSMWALNELMDCGIENDSSIFPIFHDRYGIPDSDKLPHIIRARDKQILKEFPISIYEIFGRHIPFSGGGYFRLLPTKFIAHMAKTLNTQGYPIIMYLHPWEFDPEQPRINAGMLNTFRHYVNIDSTERKLRRLLDLVDVGTMKDFKIQEEGIKLRDFNVPSLRSIDKKISVVVPVYNEEESVDELIRYIDGEVRKIALGYEIVLVDDGSVDGTVERIKQLKAEYSAVKLVKLKRNYGQTPAMVAGFDHAEGEIIITMDGDLQNDPRDIQKVLDKIYEGYDVVSGWRYNRKDNWLVLDK